jgi:hypothetical protein
MTSHFPGNLNFTSLKYILTVRQYLHYQLCHFLNLQALEIDRIIQLTSYQDNFDKLLETGEVIDLKSITRNIKTKQKEIQFPKKKTVQKIKTSRKKNRLKTINDSSPFH